MRVFILLGAALVSFAAALTLGSSDANAVFWRGISAPTNIDYHGWLIIKEPPPSPFQWIRVSGATTFGNAYTDWRNGKLPWRSWAALTRKLLKD